MGMPSQVRDLSASIHGRAIGGHSHDRTSGRNDPPPRRLGACHRLCAGRRFIVAQCGRPATDGNGEPEVRDAEVRSGCIVRQKRTSTLSSWHPELAQTDRHAATSFDDHGLISPRPDRDVTTADRHRLINGPCRKGCATPEKADVASSSSYSKFSARQISVGRPTRPLVHC